MIAKPGASNRLQAEPMGQGGYLWIINATSKKLVCVSNSSNRMVAWSFRDVPSQSMEKFYIEFSDLGTESSTGEVTFMFCDTANSFQVLICWPKKQVECGLKVNWGTLPENGYYVFPPSTSGELFGKLGWIHNGSLSLLIMDESLTSVSCHLPNQASIVPSVSTLPFPSSTVHRNWMEHYSSVLGRLTLSEMTLPGTHDSGTYRPKSDLGSMWIKTQRLSLAEQLTHGIRVLDLRIGQNSPGDYLICHNKWQTCYSLREALREVRNFVDSTRKEIVVLDFHEFVNLRKANFDFYQLKQQISSELSGYILSVTNAAKTLVTIWSCCSQKQRVVVAWNDSRTADPFMWPGVDQRWYEGVSSPSGLYQCIKSDMQNPPVRSQVHAAFPPVKATSSLAKMWATCSFMAPGFTATPHSNAVKINPSITNWYFGGSVFCDKASIISVDFFDECSNVIQACIIGSLLKAGKKGR